MERQLTDREMLLVAYGYIASQEDAEEKMVELLEKHLFPPVAMIQEITPLKGKTTEEIPF